MEKTFSRLVGILGILVTIHTLAFSSWAIDYPTKPITLICAYGPGGASDITARAIAKELEPLLGQPVVVLNKAGATGTIAMGFLASQKPDGYTIALTPGSLAFTPYFIPVSYDITKDFTYLAGICSWAEPLFVRTDSPFKTMDDFVNYARQNPDKVKIGVAGVPSSMSEMMKFVGKEAGVRWTVIPYKSDAESLTALLGGHITGAVIIGGYLPHLKAGTLRMLAVNTAERLKDFPDVPTVIECGYKFTTLTLVGIVGPKGLPEPIVQKLVEALVKVRKAPAFMEVQKTLNFVTIQETGKDYEKHVMEVYRDMAEYSKIK